MHVTNSSNLPAEAFEIEYPLLIDAYGLVPDSGGAGEFRGGLGIAREISSRVDGSLLTARGEGHFMVAPGLDGGLPGGGARLRLEPGTARERELPTATTAMRMTKGLGVRMETPGGGGFGDPRARDPAALAADILDGKVSRTAAERDYGAENVAAALAAWKEGA
jgi:N-methylhydantoinase B